MSANQAMSSARRRRGAPAQQSRPTRAVPSTNQKVSSDRSQPAPVQENNTVSGFAPVDVGPTPRNPTDLLMQHDRRLFNLENGVAEALGVLNANVSILTESYNSLSASSEGSQVLLDVQRELRSLSERVSALEATRTVDSDLKDNVEHSDDQDEDVSITFSTQ